MVAPFCAQATSALDTITENSIQEALVTLGQNRTVLIIAHRLSTIKHAHQIIVMEGGRVAEVGSHESLLSQKNSIYSRMWDMQTKSSSGDLVNEEEFSEESVTDEFSMGLLSEINGKSGNS